MTVMTAGLSGCYSLNQGVSSSPVNMELDAPYKAELSIMPKAMGQSSQTVLFGIFHVGGDNKYADGVNYAGNSSSFGGSFFDLASKVKSAAAYKVLQQTKADVLVAPTYVVQEENYLLWKTYTAVVQAYPAKIARISPQ